MDPSLRGSLPPQQREPSPSRDAKMSDVDAKKSNLKGQKKIQFASKEPETRPFTASKKVRTPVNKL